MCRKLVLTGWVLVIREDAEQARVVIALFVSISFFGLNLRFKPLKRCALVRMGGLCCVAFWRRRSSLALRRTGSHGTGVRACPCGRVEDSSLATLTHLALILTYTCVLAIKTCELSPTVCGGYGFGDSAEGEESGATVMPQRWRTLIALCLSTQTSCRILSFLHLLQLQHADRPGCVRNTRPALPHPPSEQVAAATPPRGLLC